MPFCVSLTGCVMGVRLKLVISAQAGLGILFIRSVRAACVLVVLMIVAAAGSEAAGAASATDGLWFGHQR